MAVCTGPMLAVRNLKASKTFYEDVVECNITADAGGIVEFEGGLRLIPEWPWSARTGLKPSYGESGVEVCFETADMDAFLAKCDAKGIGLVGEARENPRGQRVARIRDPDGHLVEMTESIRTVCRRMVLSGADPAAVAEKAELTKDEVLSMTDPGFIPKD